MIDRVCLGCKKEFKVYPSNLKVSCCDFCSLSCAGKNRKGVNHHAWKGGPIKKQCIQCGKDLFRKINQIKKGQGMFCSTSCSMKNSCKKHAPLFLSQRIKKECIVCGKIKLHKKSYVQKFRGTYCSKECMAHDYKTRMIGKSNPNYSAAGYENHNKNSPIRRNRERLSKIVANHSDKEWQDLKSKYNYSCACCKKKEPKIKLTKDHIIPITKDGHSGIDNIQPLCQRCNAKKHAKTIRYSHQLKIAI